MHFVFFSSSSLISFIFLILFYLSDYWPSSCLIQFGQLLFFLVSFFCLYIAIHFSLDCFSYKRKHNSRARIYFPKKHQINYWCMFFHKILFINNKQSRFSSNVFFIYKSQNFLVNRCLVKRFLFLYMCWWRPILRPIKTDMLLINNSLDEAFSFALISTKLWLLASIYMGNTSLNYLLPDKEKLCDVFGWQFPSWWEKRKEKDNMFSFSFLIHSIICNNLYR